MEKFTRLTAIVAPVDAQHVDTDQIIAKQFLKRTERSGYGEFLFFDWRYLADGKTLNPDFEMNAERYEGAGILLSRDNFGCGSSREHAPWALHDYGIRCIIAPSFADIFYNNCFNNGMLPLALPTATVDELFVELRAQPGYELSVDLVAQKVVKPDGSEISFEIDAFLRDRLLNGWDQIGLTMRYEERITEFEKQRGIV
ncbi:MAG: 3-isopropylmalate dehydratase small subunit [Candidatus Binatia bacterium]